MWSFDKDYEKALHLDVVKKILNKYPSVYVGGSVGLFLYGIRLKRWLKGESDIDLWSNKEVNINLEDILITQNDEESSGSGKDYKETLEATDNSTKFKIDLGIDKDQQYDVIFYKDLYFRVNKLENIWRAKLKYSNPKHIADLNEALRIKEPKKMLDLVL